MRSGSLPTTQQLRLIVVVMVIMNEYEATSKAIGRRNDEWTARAQRDVPTV